MSQRMAVWAAEAEIDDDDLHEVDLSNLTLGGFPTEQNELYDDGVGTYIILSLEDRVFTLFNYAFFDN